MDFKIYEISSLILWLKAYCFYFCKIRISNCDLGILIMYVCVQDLYVLSLQSRINQISNGILCSGFYFSYNFIIESKITVFFLLVNVCIRDNF